MKKYKFPLVSPLFFVGVLLILLPIFTFMTLERLERQKDFFTQRLFEKGVSLIRTFEAGTRTGMFSLRWGAGRIQDMVTETSLQPEVVYMMITTKDGKILAHSDTSMVGQMRHAMPETAALNQDPRLIGHRIREPENHPRVFEVFKRFVPIRSGSMRRRMGMNSMGMRLREKPLGRHEIKQENQDWCGPYMEGQWDKPQEIGEHYIFAGLSMAREEIARDRLLKTTVWRGVFFFILGCAGMVSLSAFQAYRAAKASLTQVKAFSDNVVQNMPSGLVTMGTDHHITSMNKAAEDILGGGLGQPFPQWIDLIEEMEVSRQGVSREISLTLDSGSTVRLDMIASPILEAKTQVMGFLFLFRDLTQIRKLKKQVGTNKRLAAIGKLAAGVAHEIRNPLSSIKGFATYFGKRYEDNEADKETAGIMVAEVERINRSVTQLLEFARPMAIEKKQVDITELIHHSLKLVHQDLAEKNIKTQVHIDVRDRMIHTDPDRMNQVFLNLYINAIDALCDTGTLEIDAVDTDLKQEIEIRVRDNGTGIDPESLDLIFDPYFTTRSTGTGLGLSIVHRIIENLGGRIRVNSAPGKGTCFIIYLPVV